MCVVCVCGYSTLTVSPHVPDAHRDPEPKLRQDMAHG